MTTPRAAQAVGGRLTLVDLPDLPQDALATMLYGSQARGNPRPDSDVDILQLVHDEPGSFSIGRLSVTRYRPVTLRAMARAGSLFIFHLRTEGVILEDSHGVFKRCLDAYSPPKNYRTMRADIQVAGLALDPSKADPQFLQGTCRLGIYLLRTTLYVEAIEKGILTFDIERILDDIGDIELTRALDLRYLKRYGPDELDLLHTQLSKRLSVPLENPFPSLEALAVASTGNPRVCPFFENLLVGQEEVDYAILTFPPF
jgi:hypothetical protein